MQSWTCMPNLVDLCIRYMYIAYYYSCILSVRLSAFYAIFKFYVNFSKLRFRKSPYNFLNLYGRFCPYNPTYKLGKKISTPPFSRRWELFSKIGHVGTVGNRIPYRTKVLPSFYLRTSSCNKAQLALLPDEVRILIFARVVAPCSPDPVVSGSNNNIAVI